MIVVIRVLTASGISIWSRFHVHFLVMMCHGLNGWAHVLVLILLKYFLLVLHGLRVREGLLRERTERGYRCACEVAIRYELVPRHRIGHR